MPVLAALLVLGGTATWSADGAARLRSHPAAVAPDRWSPAHTRTWTGRAVLRVTGWPAPVRGDRWQAPARLLAWRGEGPAPDGPRVGD
ncbi:hypothetical protein KDM41_09840, partial [bacterium]|nr:hypothetical protein [bacterium]